MYERPAYHSDAAITGFGTGQSYLTLSPRPMYNLTWVFLFRLIRLKLFSPRGSKFKLMIADYGYDN